MLFGYRPRPIDVTLRARKDFWPTDIVLGRPGGGGYCTGRLLSRGECSDTQLFVLHIDRAAKNYSGPPAMIFND